jgi:F-type H+-transporting ATPase subunit b
MEVIDLKVQYLLVQFVTFLLGIGLLWKPGFKYLGNILAQRREQIRTDLDAAQQAKLDTATLKAEYEKKLAVIEQEARAKIQASTREAQEARNEILAEARTKAEALLVQAEQTIRREQRKALVELKNEIAQLAVGAAEQVTRQRLDAAAQQALLDDVIARVGK